MVRQIPIVRRIPVAYVTYVLCIKSTAVNTYAESSSELSDFEFSSNQFRGRDMFTYLSNTI